MLRARSASTTPTNVTRGKSNPLVIICVPTSISIWPCLSASTIALRAPRRPLVSLSIRSMRASGICSVSASTSRSVPNPGLRAPSRRIREHFSGAAALAPQ